MSRERPAIDDHTRVALDAADTGLWEWLLDTERLLWDETSERLFGYEPGSFPGTYDAFIDRILETDRETVESRLTTAIETGERYEVEFRIERPDGERRWIRSFGITEVDEAGDPVRLVGTQTDVTTARERERQLERYRQLFENTTDCVVEVERVDGDSLIRRVNAAFEEVFGFTEAAVSGRDIHDVLTPEEYRDQAMEIRQEYLEGNQPVVEVTRNTADGQREFVMRAVNFEDRFYVVYTDITERKAREQELSNARAELRQIIDLIPDPIYAKNRDDEVLLSNEANAELHGMTPDEIEGIPEREIEAEVENIENFDKYRQRELDVMEAGDSTTFEEELTDPDGETHVFKTTRIPFEAAGTDEDAVLGYARDVTDQKAYEQELEQTNEKLDNFAGLVSHDLRNPLNVAQGRLDLVDGDNGEHIESAKRSLDRMETIIEDILTLSRAGETVEDPAQVRLADVVRESWETVETDPADLELQIQKAVNITADRARLQRLFENLFRNAVEHNEPSLTIQVGLIERADGTGGSTASGFYIADTGGGIPADEREDIFTHGYSTNAEGTGFGLSIVADIVEAHDWEIRVTESEDGGARFDITGVSLSN